MNKSNFQIQDVLNSDDLNSYLETTSTLCVTLLNFLNSYYKKNYITVGGINYNVIDTSSSNDLIKEFLNASFIDFVTEVYTNPSLDGINYIMQDISLEDNGDTKTQLKLKKYYYNKYGESYNNETVLLNCNPTQFKIDKTNFKLEHRSSVSNYDRYYGQSSDASGWGKTLKLPTFFVKDGHITDTNNYGYTLGEVIIKTPSPYKNKIYNGSLSTIKDGYRINIINLMSLDICIIFTDYNIKANYFIKNVKINEEKIFCISINDLSLSSFKILFLLSITYNGSYILMSYNSTLGSELNVQGTIMLTATNW